MKRLMMAGVALVTLTAKAAWTAPVDPGPGWDERNWTFDCRIPDDKIFYSVGEHPKAVITVKDADGKGVVSEKEHVQITWYRDRQTWTNLVFKLDGKPVEFDLTMDKPSHVMADAAVVIPHWRHGPGCPIVIKRVEVSPDGAKTNRVELKQGVGVFFDPQKLTPYRPLPKRPAGATPSDKVAGFNPTNDVPYAEEVDEYWDRLLAKDKEIEAAGGFKEGPLEYVRTAENGVKVYNCWMDSLGGRCYFQVSFPPGVEQGKKYPIWGIVQASGCCRPAAWTWEHSITVAPCAHSMRLDGDKAYRQQFVKDLGVYYGFSGYFYNGRGQPVVLPQNKLPNDRNESPDTCYFRDMLLRHVRAYRWVMKRPEWDGKGVSIYGQSQGGYLGLATACLVPEIKSIHIGCPWLCDLHGSHNHEERPVPLYGLNFIDGAVLAHRLKAPILKLEQGMIDHCCPPDGTMVMMNQLPKTTVVQARYYQGKPHAVPEGRVGSFVSVTVSNGVWTVLKEDIPEKKGK